MLLFYSVFLIHFSWSYTWQNMLQTGMIVGGWDKYEGGKIYGVPLGGTILEQPFSIGGMLLFLVSLF